MKYSKKFSCNLDTLPEVLKFVRDFLGKYGINGDTLHRVELAVDEAATNVIKYAYPENNGFMDIAASINNGHICFEILDEGVPFDPTVIPEPDTTTIERECKSPGLGILLMRKMTDELSYDRAEGRNHLIMRRHLPQQAH